MDEFSIGDTVTITGSVMTGSVGTVVYLDETRGKYLVHVGGTAQNYYDPDEIELFSS
ncbi:hypothetical protein [Brevibacterium marinum]|uniref:Transcription antitermination factor NusG n=1 Tax=Brevibacterium marinum TaxID=418643 RepID=A0A846RUW6_9MICO|nr:hypothetical protein [Brevibacterium marinum]NJC55255.1 transcription antitermination factor NusG [Brevibacterium marinum]